MRQGLAALVLVGVSLCACNQTMIATPSRSLDRPSDLALLCTVRQEDGSPRMAPQSACKVANEIDCVTENADGTKSYTTGDCRALKLNIDLRPQQLLGLAASTGRSEVVLFTAGPTSLGVQQLDSAGNLVFDPVVGRPVRMLDTRAGAIVDLSPGSPGFNFLPVGAAPDHIRASDDGCVAVAASSDSCELAVIDVFALVKKASDPNLRGSFPDDVVRRMPIRTGGVPLAVRPTWIEMSPATTTQALTTSTSTPDKLSVCDGTAPRRALIAFAGCNLVGEVDLATGELVQAMQLLPGGGTTPVDPAAVSCPVECSGGTAIPLPDAATPPFDASVDSDGGLPPPLPSQPQPRSLAVDTDEPVHLCAPQPASCMRGQPCTCRQLFIADAVGDQLTVVDLDSTGHFLGSRALPLEAPGGVDVVRISPRILPPPPPPDPTDHPELTALEQDDLTDPIQYVFATAHDRSVRVISADEERECEANVDPGRINTEFPIVEPNGGMENMLVQFKATNSPYEVQRKLRCPTIGDPTRPRQATATGPGIVLPGSSLPRDIGFTHIIRPPLIVDTSDAADAAPGLPVGDFAWIVDSAGRVTNVNLFDRCVQPNSPKLIFSKQACDPNGFLPAVAAAFANPGFPLPLASDFLPIHVRPGNARFFKPTSFTDLVGTPRLSDLPLVVTDVTVTVDAPPVHLCSFSASPSGPFNLCAAAPTTVETANQVHLHDPASAVAETWSFTWEGTIPGTSRTGGVVQRDNRLTDEGASLCFRGALAGDRLVLTGCGSDVECEVDQLCYLDPAAPVGSFGVCLSRDPTQFALAKSRCAPWTRSQRRYRIAEARATEVRIDELSAPEHVYDTVSCVTDDDCSGLEMVVKISDTEDKALPTSCLDSGQGHHCFVACDVAADHNCPAGYTCGASRFGGTRCLRGELPPADPQLQSLCFNHPVTYEVRVGDGFLVKGDSSGTLGGGFTDPMTGQCALPADDRGRLRRARLPIDPPACPPSIKDQNWLGPVSELPAGINSCKLEGGTPKCPADTILRFSNPTFDVVMVVPVTHALLPNFDGGLPLDADFPTLGTIIPDAGVVTSDAGFPVSCAAMTGGFVPGQTLSLVPPLGTQLSFSFLIGFHPTTVSLVSDIPAQLPRAAHVAPDKKAIYITDEGKQTAATGLKGQVLRFLTDTQATDTTFLVR